MYLQVLECSHIFWSFADVRPKKQVIRNDVDLPPHLLAAQQRYAYMHPYIASRREGAQVIRARWATAAAAANNSSKST
jgi:hypothetical protein